MEEEEEEKLFLPLWDRGGEKEAEDKEKQQQKEEEERGGQAKQEEEEDEERITITGRVHRDQLYLQDFAPIKFSLPLPEFFKKQVSKNNKLFSTVICVF